MKVIVEKGQDFAPIHATFTFESQNEVDIFASLFNYTGVTDALKTIASTKGDVSICSESIRRSLERAGASPSVYVDAWAEAIFNSPNQVSKRRL